ncbi:hypothetical protein ACOSQ4_017467 [Xanthoceras sorbifolium]
MHCVSSVSYSYLLNGEVRGFLKPSRGLRQGDLLSPYLFLLCAEGLSSLLSAMERERAIHVIVCGRGGPSISHLFFADNSLLFLKAEANECLQVQHILATYEIASGQTINREKSTVCFEDRLPATRKKELHAILGVRLLACHVRLWVHRGGVSLIRLEIEFGASSRLGNAIFFCLEEKFS